MNYNEFKDEILDRLKKAVGDGESVRLFNVHKNNGIVLSAISVVDEESKLSPSIYLERYYQLYLSGQSLDELVRLIMAENSCKQLPGPVDIERFKNPDYLADKILFRVINYDMNADYLQEVPHRRLLDLAMIYYLEVTDPIFGNATVVLRNSEVARLGLDEETLHRMALSNALRLKPARLETLCDVLMSLTGSRHTSCLTDEEKLPMFIASNEDRLYGAAVIAYPGVFKELAERLASDLFIIPSSIHELIVLSGRESFTVGELSEMVEEINATQVPTQDVLSNHVYTYVRDREMIVM